MNNNYIAILDELKELHKAHPSYNMGRHLSTALDGYGDIWGLSNKELLFALRKYRSQLEMDIDHTDDEIEGIIKDGLNLLKQEEDDNGDY